MTERKKSLLCICPSVFVMLTCVIQLLLPIKPANGTDVQRKLLMWFYFFFLNSCGFIFNDTCARCNCLSVHLCKINVGIDYATRLHRFTQTIGNIIMCLNSFSRYISSTNSHGGVSLLIIQLKCRLRIYYWFTNVFVRRRKTLFIAGKTIIMIDLEKTPSRTGKLIKKLNTAIRRVLFFCVRQLKNNSDISLLTKNGYAAMSITNKMWLGPTRLQTD